MGEKPPLGGRGGLNFAWSSIVGSRFFHDGFCRHLHEVSSGFATPPEEGLEVFGEDASQVLAAILPQRGRCSGQPTEIAACPRSIGSNDGIVEAVHVGGIYHPSSPR